MTTLLQRFLRILRWPRYQSELREEIETHRTLRQAAFERQGLATQEAAHASQLALGNVTLAMEEAREVWAIRIIDYLSQDLRSAFRALRQSPGFALVAIATFALGIGATTALFSIFSALILRPLPVQDPGSLALLTNGAWSYPVWQQIRARDDLFAGTLAWSAQRFDLSPVGKSDIIDAAYVSGQFFDVLGVNAQRGRMFTVTDDQSSAPDGPVAVISDGLWRRRFGGVDDIVGRQITVQRVPFTIVGVMPPGFFGPDIGRMMDVMVPFSGEPLIRGRESRLASGGSMWIQIMVRLKGGLDLQAANAALRAAQPEIVVTMTRGKLEPLTLAAAASGGSLLRARFAPPLVVMMATASLLLLIACANIASLMLARALARRHELGVRLAIGSSRWRIAQLLLTESLVVAMIGGSLALVLAKWGSTLLVQQLSTSQRTVGLDLTLDWRVLGFTALVSLLAATIAGLAPILGLKNVAPAEPLRDAGRAIAGDRRFALRSTLLVVQIAVSVVLVVAAALFLRTFASLSQLPLGFVPEPLLVAELNLQASGPPTERLARAERMREAAAAVPGVRSASLSAVGLLTGGGWASGEIGIGDGDVSLRRPPVWLNATTPGWFQTMGMTLRSGRDFQSGDRIGSSPVAIVNETFVRRFMSNELPVGQYVKIGDDPKVRYRVVGVVSDAVYTTPRDGMLATMYFAVEQRRPETFWPTLVLTVNSAPSSRAATERDVTTTLARIEPTVPFTFETFDQAVDATVLQERLVAMLSAYFGGLALLLAAVGIYGVIAHAVRARQTEIGLRMALGAKPSAIMRLVFRRVAVVVATGIAIGLVCSWWAASFVSALLFRVEARDLSTLAAATAVLITVASIAAWIPARRASCIDPVAALREG